MTTTTRVLAILSLLLAAAQADEPRNLSPQKDTLQAVLDRIKQHAAGEAWKQPGFKDDAIEAWLDKLLGLIAIATEINDLKLPVRLADVQVVQPDRTGTFRGHLSVSQDFKQPSMVLRDSIVLADGNATIGHVENSIVVARGIITIESASHNSILVAGIGFKGGEMDGNGRGSPGSVVITRGWAELANRAQGTIVAANAGVLPPSNLALGRATNVIYINTPVPPPGLGARGFGGAPRDDGNKSVRVRNLPLEELPVHPLEAKFKVLGVLHTVVKETDRRGAFIGAAYTGPQPTSLVFTYEGRRYMADLDQPVADESGQPLAALAGYRLARIAVPYAVFSKPDADLVLRLDGK